MLSARLGLTVPSHVLRRLHETTLGNPLFALELGRSLVERGRPEPDEDIPVPESSRISSGRRRRPRLPSVDSCSPWRSAPSFARAARRRSRTTPRSTRAWRRASYRGRGSSARVPSAARRRPSDQTGDDRAAGRCTACSRAVVTDESCAPSISPSRRPAARRGAGGDGRGRGGHGGRAGRRPRGRDARRARAPPHASRVGRPAREALRAGERLDTAGEPERLTECSWPELDCSRQGRSGPRPRPRQRRRADGPRDAEPPRHARFHGARTRRSARSCWQSVRSSRPPHASSGSPRRRGGRSRRSRTRPPGPRSSAGRSRVWPGHARSGGARSTTS